MQFNFWSVTKHLDWLKTLLPVEAQGITTLTKVRLII